ncbi:MAG: hypothetical protein V3V30_07445 [Parvularculaceae bacterium]
MKIISILATLIFILSALVAGGLYWDHEYGSCKDGCDTGMVFILFMPALGIAIVSGIVALLTRKR